MQALLYPRLSTPDSLQVWAALTECAGPPALMWELDGNPLAANQVVALRALSPVRPDNAMADPGQPRVWSGLYSIPNVDPDRAHWVRVTANGMTADCVARSLPATLPAEGFHILLCSCFHVTEANAGGIWSALAALRGHCRLTAFGRRPDLSLLMGDQVYLDLPTVRNFPDDPRWLAEDFEGKYRLNWVGGAGGGNFDLVLGAAPAAHLPDDHEYWNNFPHPSPIVQNSWSAGGRANWRGAAELAFRGFQGAAGRAPGEPILFDVPPLSFFLADTRGGRGERTFLPPAALNRLRQWSRRLDDNDYVGVFVSGQSLYAEKAKSVQGAAADWELPNYDDFEDVAEALILGRQPLICVTGDVHWGRVIRSQAWSVPGVRPVYEVIVSPAALVTAAVKDQLAIGGNWLKGLFGRRQAWPRHSDPQTAFGPFGSTRGSASRLAHSIVGQLRGDQVGLLSFTWAHNTRLSARVRLWNVGPDAVPAVDCPLF